MPAVNASVVDLFVGAYRTGLGTALAAMYVRLRSNPVLFIRQQFEALWGCGRRRWSPCAGW